MQIHPQILRILHHTISKVATWAGDEIRAHWLLHLFAAKLGLQLNYRRKLVGAGLAVLDVVKGCVVMGGTAVFILSFVHLRLTLG